LYNKDEVGMTDYQEGELTMKISSPARAMMECLYLCPNQFPLQEAYELMEGLPTLRPVQIQSLLEDCKSVKVKRLFLYFAERANHAWLKHIDVSRIDLGKGDRSLATDGTYISKYHLVLPKELV
ncbi:MAG: type IV toxin-antitoxin system AbiEi family antitoxin domain-containing protein, partial [Lentimicrobiaceae bacterium]|nr:type IV toxin-antitoxin system AbiEi family antitoxin domain-containing protein [Lentimicrobiaceae bacterium]